MAVKTLLTVVPAPFTAPAARNLYPDVLVLLRIGSIMDLEHHCSGMLSGRDLLPSFAQRLNWFAIK